MLCINFYFVKFIKIKRAIYLSNINCQLEHLSQLIFDIVDIERKTK